jgi:hypothetical protein
MWYRVIATFVLATALLSGREHRQWATMDHRLGTIPRVSWR